MKGKKAVRPKIDTAEENKDQLAKLSNGPWKQ
jgi:hypothetical protein